MQSSPQVCQSCGVEVGAAAIEGFCDRCLGSVAFGGLDEEPSDTESAIGLRLGNHELLEEIGRGGMGIVYRARQLGLGREVAVKILRGGPLSDEKDIARFRREAEITARLRHPNIVAVHDVGETDGRMYFSMDLVRGATLAEQTRDAPLNALLAAQHTQTIARAVAAAHAQGVLHRDLKPHNVIIDANDQPHVTDFGLAKQLDLTEASVTQGVMGSPSYMAPEQADPRLGPIGVASDVFSLGALLYHLLTARPPFTGDAAAATIAQALLCDPVPPRRLNPSVPKEIETICMKCLQKEPSRRYTSASELAEDLSAFLENRPIRARPVGPLEKLGLWARRRPGIAGLTNALCLALACGAGFTLWQARRNQLNLYVADLRVASEAIQSGDLGRARELLARHARPGRDDFTWKFLNAEAAGDSRTILGSHPWIVDALAWSPNGRWLLSGSVGSGTIGADTRLWDLHGAEATGRIVFERPVRDLAWFPDNQRFLATHFDGGIRVWDAFSGAELERYNGRSAGLSADGQWLITCEGHPFAWDNPAPSGPVILRNLENGTRRSLPDSRFVAMAPSGRFVATSEYSDSIKIHETTTGRHLRTLTGGAALWALTFSPDETRLVATGFDKDVRVWRLDAPEPEPTRLSGHALNTWGAAFSPDGTELATTSSDQTLRIWGIEDGSVKTILRGHGSEVWRVAYHPDGRRLASGGKDANVILWSEAPDDPPREFDCDASSAPLISPNERWALSLSASDRRETRIQEIGGSLDQRALAEGIPLAFDSKSSRWLRHISEFEIQWVALETSAMEPRVTLVHETDEPTPTWWAATPDGSRIAGMTELGEVSLWETRSGKRLTLMSAPDAEPWSLHLSPNAKYLAITAGEQGFWICSFERKTTERIVAHKDQGKWAAFSPDNRFLATASVDATIKLWDAKTLRELATLTGHRTEVSCIAFAPDNATLVSSETGIGLRFWNVSTAREIAALSMPEALDWIGFAPNGASLAIRVANNHVRLLKTTDKTTPPP